MTTERALYLALAAMQDCNREVQRQCSPAYATEFREAIDHIIWLLTPLPAPSSPLPAPSQPTPNS